MSTISHRGASGSGFMPTTVPALRTPYGVVELPAHADGEVEVRADAVAGDAHLAGPGHPPVVGHLAGGAQGGPNGGLVLLQLGIVGRIHALAHTDDHRGVGQLVAVVVAVAPDDLQAAAARRVLRRPAGRWAVAIGPGEGEHPGAHRGHLDRRRAEDLSHQPSAEGRFHGNELPGFVHLQPDRVTSEPCTQRRGHPGSHLAAPCCPRRQHGPWLDFRGPSRHGRSPGLPRPAMGSYRGWRH